jgi:hypothetical protein
MTLITRLTYGCFIVFLLLVTATVHAQQKNIFDAAVTAIKKISNAVQQYSPAIILFLSPQRLHKQDRMSEAFRLSHPASIKYTTYSPHLGKNLCSALSGAVMVFMC